MPRRLAANNTHDCAFAVQFAQGALKELRDIQTHQEMFDMNDDDLPTRGLESHYGYFGKSTLLVEGIRPSIEGTRHLSIQLGVLGCGRSTFIWEFLAEVYRGDYMYSAGPLPSLLLSSCTNEQCKKLFMMALAARMKGEFYVPEITWCVSQQFRQKLEDAEDYSTLISVSDKHEWPRMNHIYVCTHDYAVQRYASSCIDIVVLDEVGALDRYCACSVNVLSTLVLSSALRSPR